MFKCSVCEREFKSVYSLNSHVRVHRPNYNKRAGYQVGAGAMQAEAFIQRTKEYEKNPKKCKHCENILPFMRVGDPRQFCSKSCATSYNNCHKTYGIRRSKLERFVELKLSTLYPLLNIHYNQNTAIGYEIDLFIPSLFLAIEFNGICHYKPIYGDEQFRRTVERDGLKRTLCQEKDIELITLDVSKHSFTEKNSVQYVEMIIKHIERKDGSELYTRCTRFPPYESGEPPLLHTRIIT